MKSFLSISAAVIIIVAGFILIFLITQQRQRPNTSGTYVALGSSFAAGIGLGQRIPHSPFVCMRTSGGYPSLLARKLNLDLVDMTCSGSTMAHILNGGQLFSRPQLDAVGPSARLVTITSGGNDVGYITDLMAASGGLARIRAIFTGKSKPVDARPFDRVTANLVAIAREVRRRAPAAEILFVTYPVIVSPGRHCAHLGIDRQTAELSREVGARLASATRLAAARANAMLVDIDALSSGHGVCSATPWVNGASPTTGTSFHPNAAGAEAVSAAIFDALIASRRLSRP